MIKVLQMGLGPIGRQLTRYLSEREGIQIVGGVDPDTNKSGKDIGIHSGLEEMGVIISSDIASALSGFEADVAVISTLSSLSKLEPQIKEAADYRLHVVSTCEELSFPFNTQPELAGRIDNYCLEKGVACLGTGVNPGFLMDYLPSVLTSVCRKVDHVRVERYQDAENRRIPFQEKIGAGLDLDEFDKKQDSIRHVGLTESVYMLAHAINRQLDRVEEDLKPVMAAGVEKHGQKKVAGVRQVARGYAGESEVILLDFKAAVGLEQSYDSIQISGEPGFSSTIQGGINGDIATSAIVVNAVRSISNARPGLRTMLDIPVPSYFHKI